jgi:hypothetical protein
VPLANDHIIAQNINRQSTVDSRQSTVDSRRRRESSSDSRAANSRSAAASLHEMLSRASAAKAR